MDIKTARFQRRMRQRIADTFPQSRLPFFQSLRMEQLFSAFQRIERILQDRERTWHLVLVALHVLYEGWHDLPSLSVAERRVLGRSARSLRDVAERLRGRSHGAGDGAGAAELERMADRLDGIVCPSADGIYNLKGSCRRRFDPREAIPVFELANLFRQRLSEVGFYPVIVALMNSVPGQPGRYSVATVKKKLAQMARAGYVPRVQFIYSDPDVITLKFRDEPDSGRGREPLS